MKILWISTAPWCKVSFSHLTADITPRIRALGHDVTIAAWHGIQGERRLWKGIQVIPTPKNCHSYLELYKHGKYDLAILCDDAFTIHPEVAKQMNIIMWSANHHVPPTQSVVQSLQAATKAYCYSQWGTDILRQAGVDVNYLPCSISGFNNSIEKISARKLMGIAEDAFMISVVASNSDKFDRKGWADIMSAYNTFSKQHDNTVLFCLTRYPGVMDLRLMGSTLGIKGTILYPDQYEYENSLIGKDFLKLLYSTSDVLLSASKWEGFNMPLVEAQRCGCPILAPNFGTTDELLFLGDKIDGQLYWQNDARTWGFQVFQQSIVDKLNAMYEHPFTEEQKKDASVKASQFDTDVIFEKYWSVIFS